MFLAYLDESGDKGWSGTTDYFVLSCLLVHDSQWLSTLDQVVDLRRRLRDRWGVLVRPEIKARHFRWGHGPFDGLGIGLRDRLNIFKDCMDFQATNLNTTVFAIAINKSLIFNRSRDGRYWAWRFALQRINTFCSKQGERAMIFPDEGHAVFVKRLTRELRRYNALSGFYGGKLVIPLTSVIEDPVSLGSQDSYFIQLADWNAYAAHRSKWVDPTKKVPLDLWDRLGSNLLLDVNKNTGGPPGIVCWP